MLDFTLLQLDNKDPVYIQISNYVKGKILTGQLISGDPLPSRREVASLLSINPNTVQKAYRHMEQEGFLVTSGNTGSMVYTDPEILRKIEEELTKDMIKAFIKSAKEINLSFKRVFDLVSDLWDSET